MQSSSSSLKQRRLCNNNNNSRFSDMKLLRLLHLCLLQGSLWMRCTSTATAAAVMVRDQRVTNRQTTQTTITASPVGLDESRRKVQAQDEYDIDDDDEDDDDDDDILYCQLHLNDVMLVAHRADENESESDREVTIAAMAAASGANTSPVSYHRNRVINSNNQIEEVVAAESEFYSCLPIHFGSKKNNTSMNNTDRTARRGTYTITIPEWIEQQEKAKLESGQAPVYLSIPGGSLTVDQVYIPHPERITVVSAADGDDTPSFLHHDIQQRQRHGRALGKPATRGRLSVVVLRIIANDAQPDFTASELYNLIFVADPSMKTQYEKCSWGQLIMEATKYGVMDVYINAQAQGNTNAALMNMAENVADDILQSNGDGDSIRDYADLIMFVVPPGTGGWAAYATVNGKQSVYNDRWAGYLGGQMHEVGHNLGLRHAYENGNEYDGKTGYMGSAPQQTLYPEQCFNAQNHYLLRWFEDRTIEVEPEIPVLVKVAAFVDYDRVESENTLSAASVIANGAGLQYDDSYIIVKVNDLFLQYNRAKDFNKDTMEQGDRLTIVRGQDDRTEQLGGLGPGEQLTITSAATHSGVQTMTTGEQVTIEVCQEVFESQWSSGADFLVVSVGYGDSLCPQQQPPISLAPPTSRPTYPPTHRPTRHPTRSPTPMPTPLPTPLPSLMPTTYAARSRKPIIFRWPTREPTLVPVPPSPPEEPTPSVPRFTPAPSTIPRLSSPTSIPKFDGDSGQPGNDNSESNSSSARTVTRALLISALVLSLVAAVVGFVFLWYCWPRRRKCKQQAKYHGDVVEIESDVIPMSDYFEVIKMGKHKVAGVSVASSASASPGAPAILNRERAAGNMNYFKKNETDSESTASSSSSTDQAVVNNYNDVDQKESDKNGFGSWLRVPRLFRRTRGRVATTTPPMQTTIHVVSTVDDEACNSNVAYGGDHGRPPSPRDFGSALFDSLPTCSSTTPGWMQTIDPSTPRGSYDNNILASHMRKAIQMLRSQNNDSNNNHTRNEQVPGTNLSSWVAFAQNTIQDSFDGSFQGVFSQQDSLCLTEEQIADWRLLHQRTPTIRSGEGRAPYSDEQSVVAERHSRNLLVPPSPTPRLPSPPRRSRHQQSPQRPNRRSQVRPSSPLPLSRQQQLERRVSPQRSRMRSSRRPSSPIQQDQRAQSPDQDRKSTVQELPWFFGM